VNVSAVVSWKSARFTTFFLGEPLAAGSGLIERQSQVICGRAALHLPRAPIASATSSLPLVAARHL